MLIDFCESIDMEPCDVRDRRHGIPAKIRATHQAGNGSPRSGDCTRNDVGCLNWPIRPDIRDQTQPVSNAVTKSS